MLGTGFARFDVEQLAAIVIDLQAGVLVVESSSFTRPVLLSEHNADNVAAWIDRNGLRYPGGLAV